MRFKFYVTETRWQNVVYEIEADNYDAAVDKAMIGDTLNEDTDGEFGVIDRVIDGEVQGVEQ